MTKNHDLVKKPKHYTQFQIQPMEFASVNNLEHWQYQVLKYILRYKEKNGLEDLKKALVFLNCQIQYLETGKFLTPDKKEMKTWIVKNAK